VHAIDENARNFVDIVSNHEFDKVIHCGDWVSEDFFNFLSNKFDVIGVYGNMDEFSLQMKLPALFIGEIGGYRIGIFHGRGSPSETYDMVFDIASRERVNFMFFGHTHEMFFKKINDILFFNPGSSRYPYGSYLIIDTEKDEAYFYNLSRELIKKLKY